MSAIISKLRLQPSGAGPTTPHREGLVGSVNVTALENKSR